MALTPKKRAFIAALRGGASNRDAAIAAGCPEKSASAAGSRLAKDPDVVAEMNKLRALGLMPGDVKADVKGDVKGGSVGPARDSPSAPPEADAQSVEGEWEPAGFDLSRALSHKDPKDFLLAVMNDMGTEAKLRVDAAKALMPFVHPRKGESGKKEQAKEKAADAASGKFGARRGPLRSVK
ncbi:terminase small subunit [Pseudomonas vranovensis]|uniref:Terminase n=1 Tax=Pseudomonas vranovensis TaxID=321661 RepID=A0A423CZ68_9PSED|nr:terminase small subunit [Pseudomonas vranovensis]ROL64599.1 terminase [Pseudomonas vranovensis]